MHYLPDAYKQALKKAGLDRPDGFQTPEWNEQLHLEIMDRMNINVAMISLSSPSVHFGDDEAARGLAREVNEVGARLVSDHMGRFGFMASLPLPDLDGALSEIDYAFDILKADGVVLYTNHRGIYLGDKSLEPIFAELSRRRAVVFIHPTKPSAVPANVLEGFPMPGLEYIFDTTRAVTNLILNGTLQRNPGVKIIVPHAGAAMPILVNRIYGMLQHLESTGQVSSIPHVISELRSLHYDLAGQPVPYQLMALLKLVGSERILYGSDVPYTAEVPSTLLLQKIRSTEFLSDTQRQAIFEDNALALFPRLKRSILKPDVAIFSTTCEG